VQHIAFEAEPEGEIFQKPGEGRVISLTQWRSFKSDLFEQLDRSPSRLNTYHVIQCYTSRFQAPDGTKRYDKAALADRHMCEDIQFLSDLDLFLADFDEVLRTGHNKC
jgi:hypothetical protein